MSPTQTTVNEEPLTTNNAEHADAVGNDTTVGNDSQLTSDNAPLDEGEDREYVIDKLIGHDRRADGMFYRVHWYGYRKADATWEPAANIPSHFISRYHRYADRLSKQKRSRRRGGRR